MFVLEANVVFWTRVWRTCGRSTSPSDTLSGAGERRPAFSLVRVALVYMVKTFCVWQRRETQQSSAVM